MITADEIQEKAELAKAQAIVYLREGLKIPEEANWPRNFVENIIAAAVLEVAAQYARGIKEAKDDNH